MESVLSAIHESKDAGLDIIVRLVHSQVSRLIGCILRHQHLVKHYMVLCKKE